MLAIMHVDPEAAARQVPKMALTLEEVEWSYGSIALVASLRACGALVPARRIGRTLLFDTDDVRRVWAEFRQGLLTNLLNPKVALFVLAFLPQFIAPDAAHPSLAFLPLGAVLVLQGTLFLAVLVALASRLRRLGSSPRGARWLQALGGSLFLGLAARLALAEAH